MTPDTESDGFETVTPINTAKRFAERYEDGAFRAMNAADGANFYLALAYKHGGRDCLQKARDRLAEAVAVLDEALASEDAA